jgi:DNA replication and repair protein RecF
MAIRFLRLVNFRNHKELDISTGGGNVLITGPNGAGKTNILEAISLLSPGRGIFNAKHQEMLNIENKSNNYGIFSETFSMDNVHKIGTGYNALSSKRTIKINDTEIQKQHDILEFLRVIWLIPQMDSTLSGNLTQKRRFIDRLTFNFFPLHSKSAITYEYALKSRSKVLSEGPYDDILLSTFEKIMAEEAIKIATFRRESVSLISSQLNKFSTKFLVPFIEINCDIDKDIVQHNKNLIIDRIMSKLRQCRRIDTLTKKCGYGVHRTEIKFLHSSKLLDAEFCSTGEKKAMLISLIIAQVMMLQSIFNGSIVLLLDDIFSHLDRTFSQNLINELSILKAQKWITGTQELNACKEYIAIRI